MTTPVNKNSTENTIKALTDFSRSNSKKKIYLKIEYTSEGKPYLRSVDTFGLWDLIQWYFTHRFDLDKVVQVSRDVLNDSNLFDDKRLSNALNALNKKIEKYNKNHKTEIITIDLPAPHHYGVPQARAPLPVPIPVPVHSYRQVQGISNAGNTCYINSTIQGLRACESFKQILPNESKLGHAFNRVFTQIESGSAPLSGFSGEMKTLRQSFGSIGFNEAFSGIEEDPNSLLLPIVNSLNFRVTPQDSPFPYPHLSLVAEDLSINTILNRLKIALKIPAEDFLPIFVSRHDDKGNKLFNQVMPDRLITVGNDRYSLKSVIIHHGTGAARGHYTAAVPIPNSQNWIHYNDSTVSEGGKDLNSLICKNATLFFYEKVK